NQPPAANPGDQRRPSAPSARRLLLLRCIHIGMVMAPPSRPPNRSRSPGNESTADPAVTALPARPRVAANLTSWPTTTRKYPTRATPITIVAAVASGISDTNRCADPAFDGTGCHASPSQYQRRSGEYNGSLIWPSAP